MAVAKLAKLLIITHKSDEPELLKALQKRAVVEINPYVLEENPSISSSSDSDSYKIDDRQIKKIIEILEGCRSRKEQKVASKAGKYVVKKTEYEMIGNREDFKDIIEEISGYDNEIKNNEIKIAEINNKINLLKKWQYFHGNIEDLGRFKNFVIRLAGFRLKSSEFKKISGQLHRHNIAFELLNRSGDMLALILAYHNDFKPEAEEYLNSISFDEAELDGYKGTVEDNINNLIKSLKYHNDRKEILLKLLRDMDSRYYRDLIIYLDYVENNNDIEEALDSNFPTENASVYTGWVANKEKNKVFSLFDKFKHSKIYEIEPKEDEELPIILDNKPVFKPFELVINLYGVPRYFEIDPTPFVSLFFALFFGLCLTDAGYGFIFIILAAIIYFKIKTARKMALLIFFLGIFTVIAGALFNGWFGDLPAYVGGEKFFSRFALFGDPMKSESGAMNFFRLALLLGVIQVIFGLFIKLFDNIRKKNYGIAFLDTLPWIIIVISLIIILLSGDIAVNMQIVDAPIFPSFLPGILIWLLIPAALVIILFSAREQKSWGFRLFMGFLNLTIVNGITSFLGDFLSYIRLMALGLVTAGIGVAINKIAFQLGSIPVIGIIIVILGLIFGHIFNMGINILGGFVHTLRLQYVEFFSKFYEGGGRPFKEFKEEHNYITLVD
ncbi:MAG: V-type ATP synthase subunit I [Actinobacteria bacterium]|nr:V-type ATP synthase subunit I [Actinomycetota bacterium]